MVSKFNALERYGLFVVLEVDYDGRVGAVYDNYIGVRVECLDFDIALSKDEVEGT